MGKRAAAAVLLPVVAILAACGANATHVATPTTTSSSTTVLSSTTVPPPPASTTPVPTSTTAVASSAPLCTNGQVVVSDSGGGAGLGHEDQVILFTNDSPSTCTLTGYPGVAGLNANGQQVVQARRTPSGYLGGLWNDATTPPRVLLNPGQRASAIPQEPQPLALTTTTCWSPHRT